ncbi:hypothetical protein JCM16138_09440 [Thermococcus atlanticus]
MLGKIGGAIPQNYDYPKYWLSVRDKRAEEHVKRGQCNELFGISCPFDGVNDISYILMRWNISKYAVLDTRFDRMWIIYYQKKEVSKGKFKSTKNCL